MAPQRQRLRSRRFASPATSAGCACRRSRSAPAAAALAHWPSPRPTNSADTNFDRPGMGSLAFLPWVEATLLTGTYCNRLYYVPVSNIIKPGARERVVTPRRTRSSGRTGVSIGGGLNGGTGHVTYLTYRYVLGWLIIRTGE